MSSTDDTQTPTDGAHERALDIQSSLDYESSQPVSDGEITPLQFQSRETFNRFSRDIYKDKDAAVREPTTNAITAVRQAVRLFGLEHPQVEITLSYDSTEEEAFLTIRDNGVGVSRYVLDNGMGVVGASTSSDDGEVAGMWGMGFFATYMLTGPNGGFPMFTHSREEGETPLNVVWREYGGREEISNHPNQFSEDEYGTELMIPVRSDIDVSDIREWVYTHCEWARVPVLYEEYCDGRPTEHTEEFGNRKFSDDYSETAPVLEYSNDYFEVVASPDAKGRIVVLDSPTKGDMWGLDLTDSDWNVDIRLLNESGIICDGPNVGMVPTERDIYETMPESRREKYILETDMSSDDISIPKLTGTRDEVAKNRPFWRYVSEIANNLYDEYVSEIFSRVHTRDDFFTLDTREQALLMSQIDEKGIKNAYDISRVCEERFDRELETKLAAELYLLRRTVKKVRRFSTFGSGKKTDSNPTRVWQVLATLGEGTVYMGKVLDQQKCNVIWNDHDDNVIVQLNKDQTYNIFQEPLGWSLAKRVTSKTIDDFDVPEDIKEAFRLNKSSSTGGYRRVGMKDLPERKLTVHSGSYRSTKKPEAGELRVQALAIDRGELGSFSKGYTHLVLFPTATDRKISEHSHLVSSNVAMASTTNQIANYVGSDVSCVSTIDEFLDDATEVRLPSSEGLLTLEQASRGSNSLLVHLMDDEYVEAFRDGDYLTAAADWIHTNNTYQRKLDGFAEVARHNFVFLPVTAKELSMVQPVLYDLIHDELGPRTIWFNRGSGPFYNVSGVKASTINEDGDLYAALRLAGWSETTEYETLATAGKTLTRGHKQLIDFYAELHDLGVSPASTELEELYAPELPVKTNKGTFNVTEADALDGCELVFHICPIETVDLFRNDDVIQKARNYVDATATRKFGSGSYIDSGSEVVYAPVTAMEYETFKPFLSRSNTVVGDHSHVRSDNKGNLPSDTAVYAAARLPNYSESAVLSQLQEFSPSLKTDGRVLVETLAELHDAGVPLTKLHD
jgi:hypothetical protein